jgi:hypothetical protein
VCGREKRCSSGRYDALAFAIDQSPSARISGSRWFCTNRSAEGRASSAQHGAKRSAGYGMKNDFEFLQGRQGFVRPAKAGSFLFATILSALTRWANHLRPFCGGASRDSYTESDLF